MSLLLVFSWCVADQVKGHCVTLCLCVCGWDRLRYGVPKKGLIPDGIRICGFPYLTPKLLNFESIFVYLFNLKL